VELVRSAPNRADRGGHFAAGRLATPADAALIDAAGPTSLCGPGYSSPESQAMANCHCAGVHNYDDAAYWPRFQSLEQP